jgi:CubicO group peptidase (beta-lactamase class C family)
MPRSRLPLRSRHLRRAACLLAVLPFAACDSTIEPHVEDDGTAYVPSATWRTASPAALGLDPDRIARLAGDVTAQRYGVIDGVIVVRYGYVALEHYVGWSAAQPHTMQSVSKSVTSLLYGILDEPNPTTARLDRSVLDVFSRYGDLQNVDARKRALTLGHLLEMRTSMDFWEQPYAGSPLDQMNRSTGDWIRFVLDRSMTGSPGSAWSYNSGAAIVSCGVIREVTGTAPDAFARQNLFAPIGVSGETWFRSPFDNLPHCGGGLGLKPMDMARVGYLVLRGGRWGDRVVVPASWITASTRAITRPTPGFFTGLNPGYGYFWWLFPITRGGSDTGVITASGAGGQWIFVVPALDLVVAIVAQSGNGLDLLYDGVLPAVVGR